MKQALAPYTGLPQFKSNMEEAYHRHLNTLLAAGEIYAFNYEQWSCVVGVNEKGRKTRFTPDFCVINGHLKTEWHEVKGSKDARGQKAALARLYAAADKYPYWRWYLVTYDEHGNWRYQEVREK